VTLAARAGAAAMDSPWSVLAEAAAARPAKNVRRRITSRPMFALSSDWPDFCIHGNPTGMREVKSQWNRLAGLEIVA
jgi:hypothetical protein